VFLTFILLVDQASLQNVINTTRIFINPDIPEAVEFKNRFVLRLNYYIIFTDVWIFYLINCFNNLFLLVLLCMGLIWSPLSL
jgi:hypothetical protein